MLVFRGQHLGAGDIAAFGRRFGTPRIHSLVSYRHEEHPEVSWLRNVDEEGNIDWYGVKRATDWHTDSTYEEELPLLAMLHALEIPATKGGTMFADMRAAYDGLPQAMKDRLSGLVGLHGRTDGPAGARPISRVDYIAIENADDEMLGAIAVGLAAGAKQAGISISGGEISQLKDVIHGFDLIGMAVGIVPLDRIITGRDLARGDIIIGLESNGIHSNGLTLARQAFFERAKLPIDHVFPELGISLGEELLRPTLIYVREILDIINEVSSVKALINITGDGLLNLHRVHATVGFEIDNLPPAPAVFRLIQQYGAIGNAEMFEVYNMGVGFCVLVAERDRDAALATLRRHGRRAQVIGRVIEDDSKGVHLPGQKLTGHGKEFRDQ